ncbi:MAG: CheR family methyltransferase [Pseudomonadota bacterium]
MIEKSHTAFSGRPLIVGIGASAGGLEAFQQFLLGLPDKHSMVLILVQHLDPAHNSLMPELVAAKTSSPVHSAEDGMQVEPGSIYLIPPGYDMEIKDGRLELEAIASPRGLRRPIDRFFHSLAEEAREHSVAVVLSGTGSDGTAGAREVKGAGGLVFVQDPQQAKYDGMPQSVLNHGGADVVSKAEEIIDVIRDYYNLRVGTASDFADDEEFLRRIMRHVKFRTGHDFSDYKQGTMLRRAAVRMSVLNMIAPGDYLKYIAEHKEEADHLFKDLLINVTSFFRDPEHFEALKYDIIPKVVSDCGDLEEIRVWVAGCSSGEEAYSVAMLLSEEVSKQNFRGKVIVFGTDIDEAALATARIGRYPDSIAETVPQDFLDRYFKSRNEGYEVGSELREMVRFSRHNFIKDPPFSKINLICCRNVLIYFKEVLQETAIKVFHYALKDPGYLYIGPSENPKPISDYFSEMSARARIFKRLSGPSKPLNLMGLTGSLEPRSPARDIPPSQNEPSELEKALLADHLPPYIHIGRDAEVLFTSTNATRFLRVRSGKLSSSLNDLIAPELEPAIRRICRIDAVQGSRVEREYQGAINGSEERLVLTAQRLADGTILIVFNDQLNLVDGRLGTGKVEVEEGAYIQKLEAELDEAKQAVRTTVEELETSNEELKSSNEEMMSMNEELQSANEELTTINDELQEKIRELAQVNADLKNFSESAQVSTVFLDRELRLRSYTDEALGYFNFAETDYGRPIADLNSRIDQDKLIELCRTALAQDRQLEHEFETDDGSEALACNIIPYAPENSHDLGVVFTLQDVTELRSAIRNAEAMKALAENRAVEVEQIYHNSPLAMGLIDRDMKYVRLNQKLADINGEPVDAHIGRTIRDIIPAVADQTEALVKTVLETGEAVRGVRVDGNIKSEPNKPRIWEADWVPHYSGDELSAVAVTVRDITAQTETDQSLRRVMRELEHRVKNMLANVTALVNQGRREASADKDVYTKLVNRIEGLTKTHTLLTSENWSSATLREIIGPETQDIYGDDRISMGGPEIRVNSQATLAIGMAIHELATNAAKYGALATEEGVVNVSWSRVNDAQSDRLVIEWHETGGPEISVPENAGFGSRLLTSTIEGTLNGAIERSWEPNGLKLVMLMDYDGVTSANVGSG